MLLGTGFLLGNLAGTSKISVLGAFFCVVIGLGCAILAIKLNKRSTYLFFAAFFMLLGFFLFLSSLKIIPAGISQLWPLAAVFLGLALIPAGWHRYGVFKRHYAVPALAFIALGSLLLVFSFNIVPFSFSQFMINWWPLLMAISGLMLAIISASTKNSGSRRPPPKDGPAVTKE
jgi:hypothetical protein